VLLGDFWRPTLDLALAEASNPAGARALRSSVRYASTPEEAVRFAINT
jgi:hypothetical protein